MACYVERDGLGTALLSLGGHGNHVQISVPGDVIRAAARALEFGAAERTRERAEADAESIAPSLAELRTYDREQAHREVLGAGITQILYCPLCSCTKSGDVREPNGVVSVSCSDERCRCHTEDAGVQVAVTSVVPPPRFPLDEPDYGPVTPGERFAALADAYDEAGR